MALKMHCWCNRKHQQQSRTTIMQWNSPGSPGPGVEPMPPRWDEGQHNHHTTNGCQVKRLPATVHDRGYVGGQSWVAVVAAGRVTFEPCWWCSSYAALLLTWEANLTPGPGDMRTATVYILNCPLLLVKVSIQLCFHVWQPHEWGTDPIAAASCITSPLTVMSDLWIGFPPVKKWEQGGLGYTNRGHSNVAWFLHLSNAQHT